jgi:hypothetical protein
VIFLGGRRRPSPASDPGSQACLFRESGKDLQHADLSDSVGIIPLCTGNASDGQPFPMLGPSRCQMDE